MNKMFLDAFAFLSGSLECPVTSLVKRREKVPEPESSEGNKDRFIPDASEREETPLYRTGLDSRYGTDKWEFTAK